jgi:hypothetical protein
MSEDRYVHPTDGGDDPRDIDQEFADPDAAARTQRERQVTNAQEPEREQGTSADAPGENPADRDRI